MCSFDDLCQKHGLDKNDFYRYLQLREYFSENMEGLCPMEVPHVIQIFMNAFNLGNSNGLVSKLYCSVEGKSKQGFVPSQNFKYF